MFPVLRVGSEERGGGRKMGKGRERRRRKGIMLASYGPDALKGVIFCL